VIPGNGIDLKSEHQQRRNFVTILNFIFKSKMELENKFKLSFDELL